MSRKPTRWYRPRNVLLVIGLIVVGVVFYAVVWALTAEPEPVIDYGRRIETLTARAQLPGENGWPYLVEAARIMAEVQAGLPPEGIDFEALQAEDLAIIRGVIADLEAGGAFDQLALAGRCPNAVHPRPALDEGVLFFSNMPELAQLRTLGRARVASMELAIADGAHDDAVQAFDQVLVIARACSHQPTLIEQLVGWSVAMLALERLRYGLDEHPMDAPTLRRFRERLGDRTPLGHPALGLEGQRLAFKDVIQRSYSDNGRGNGRLIPTAAGEFVDLAAADAPVPAKANSPRIINLLGFAMASRQAVTEKADAYYDEMVRRSRLTYGRRHAKGADPNVNVDHLGPRYFLLKMFVPSSSHFVDRVDIVRCMIDGTVLQLAVEGYRVERGQLPPSLEALVPAWIDAVPGDPFSESSFVYRLVPGSEPGGGYLLYSVGADGRDDDGIGNPQAVATALTPRGVGQDYVLNLPRPAAE
jgi:hypothetical protein